jgi:hypothetical protein
VHLIAISQRDAMLTTMSLSGSPIWPPTLAGSRPDPDRHHKKALVSRRNSQRPLEQLRDLLVRGYWRELHERFAVARDHDLLATECALHEPRKRAFCLVHVYDFGHCNRS